MSARAVPGAARGAGVTAEQLGSLELFAGLGPGGLEAIAHRCRGRTYGAGRHVVEHRESSNELFFVLAGRLRVMLYSASGRDVSFRDLGPGAVFGELAAIDGQPRAATVVAVEATRLAVMGRADFLGLVRTDPGVAEALLRHLAGLIRRYSERVFELSTFRVEERIRLELLRGADRSPALEGGIVLHPAPTLAELASRVSTTREAVSREIARLCRAGLLERRDRDLLIRDPGRSPRASGRGAGRGAATWAQPIACARQVVPPLRRVAAR